MEEKKRVRSILLIGALALAVVAVTTAAALYLTSNMGSAGYQKKIEIARQCLSREDYDGAISAYYEAIEMDESKDTAYLGLADLYESRGEMTYMNYVLDLGVRRSGSAELNSRLRDLGAYLINRKDEGGILQTNEDLLLRLADYNYQTIRRDYGDAPSADAIEETYLEGRFQKLVYAESGVVFYFTDNAMADISRPQEVHLNDLSVLFSGVQESLSLSELESLDVEPEQTTLSGIGKAIRFVMDGCEVLLPCQSDGETVLRDAVVYILPMDHREEDAGATHVVTGEIIDATTGAGVPDVNVRILRNGTEIDQTVSDSSGAYRLEKLQPGDYELICEAEDYISADLDCDVSEWKSETEQNVTLVPELEGGMIRLVLTWGQSPSDLDSYLFCDEGVVWFGARSVSNSEGKVADLDLDDTDSYGPETTTIYQPQGEYHFMVQDFRHEGRMGSSDATVSVYIGDALVETIEVDSDVTDYWDVCVIEDGELTVINEPTEAFG